MQGRGRQLGLGLAFVLAILLGSLFLAWQRERGPSEWTIEQAVAGVQLAEGDGWSTSVNYPQTIAVLEARDRLDFFAPQPELHHPPLYGALIGGCLGLLGDEGRQALLTTDARNPTAAFGGDRLLLGLNVLGLWLTAAATFALGCWLWRPTVGVLATAAVILSTPLWEHVVAVDGTSWLMLLSTLLLAALAWLDRGPKLAWQIVAAVGAGAFLGLLGLGDYALLVWLPLALVWIVWRGQGVGRWALPLVTLVAALAVLGPWWLRNLDLTGHPLGLAGQNVALKAGDPTADPLAIRATFEATGLELSFRKLLHKGLAGWREMLGSGLGGAGLFGLLALLSAVYPFQRAEVDRWRWLLLALLAAAVLVPPFLVSGLSPRSPVLYLLPGLALAGVAFFSVVLKNTRSGRPAWQIGGVAALLVLHSLPLLHFALEPRRLPFQYPPYFPASLQQLATVDAQFGTRSGSVADLPAGWSWYAGGDFRVWQQPADFAQWNRLTDYAPVHLQYFSPQLVDEQFGAALIPPPEPGWEVVYAGLATGRPPADYPLQRVQALPGGGLIALPDR